MADEKDQKGLDAWTYNDVKSADFLVLRNNITNFVEDVISPNGLQVGLLDESFDANLFVAGPITSSNAIVAEYGFTGSLQKLTNGNDYLTSSGGISVTNNPVGSISLGVDIFGQDTVSAATGDFVLIYDVSESGDLKLKKTTVTSIQSSAGMDIAGLAESLTDTTLASADLFAVADVNDSNNVKKITVEDITEFQASLANAGIRDSAGKILLDFNSLSAGVVDVATDSFAFVDSNDSNSTKKDKITDLVDLMRGTSTTTGLNSTAGVLRVDINGQASVSAASADEVLIYDASSGAIKKTTVSSIQAAGTSIDIAGLAGSLTDTTLASGDLLAVADINDGNTVKKITVQDLGEWFAAADAGITNVAGLPELCRYRLVGTRPARWAN